MRSNRSWLRTVAPTRAAAGPLMRPGRSRLFSLAVLLTLLAARGVHKSGPRPSGSAFSASNPFGAPAVKSPVEVSAVAAPPCTSLLTSAELAQLGFRSQGRQRTSIDVQ